MRISQFIFSSRFEVLVIFLLLFTPNLLRAAEFDPYKVLGLSKTASQTQIKKAYKQLAREWHKYGNFSGFGAFTSTLICQRGKMEWHFGIALPLWLKAMDNQKITCKPVCKVLSSEEKRANYDKYGDTDDTQAYGQQRQPFRHYHDSFYFDESFFHFPFNKGNRDFADNKYMLHYSQYINDIVPDSFKKPYLIKITSDWCFSCIHIEPIWKEAVQELETMGVGIGVVDVGYERRLANHLGAHRTPSILGLINGKVTFFHYAVVREHLRQFVENLLPQKLIEKLTAFAYKDYVQFGYVDQTSSESKSLLRQYNINTIIPAMLIFKEKTDQPADMIQAREMKRQIIDDFVSSNKFLLVPRLVNQKLFDELCPVKQTHRRRKYCVILITGEQDSISNGYTAFLEFASSNNKDIFRFAYVNQKQQKALCDVLLKDLDSTFPQVVILERRNTAGRVFYKPISGGWNGSEDDKFKLLKSLEQLQMDPSILSKDAVLPELNNEFAAMFLLRWIYTVYDYLSQFGEDLLHNNCDSGDDKQVKTKPKDDSQKTADNGSPSNTNQSSRAPKKNFVEVTELTDITYISNLVRLRPGHINVVLVLTDSTKNVLLSKFAKEVYSFTGSLTLHFSFLNMDKHHEWMESLLEFAQDAVQIDTDEDDNHHRLDYTGYVLALNGYKKYFCLFKPVYTGEDQDIDTITHYSDLPGAQAQPVYPSVVAGTPSLASFCVHILARKGNISVPLVAFLSHGLLVWLSYPHSYYSQKCLVICFDVSNREYIMELPNYSRQLMQQLHALRKEGQFCDCTILIGNTPYRAHKLVLAASSLLFKSLLESSDTISIDSAVVTSDEFVNLLEMVYTGKLRPGKHNFTKIISIADSLQMFDVAVSCKNIINDLIQKSVSYPVETTVEPHNREVQEQSQSVPQNPAVISFLSNSVAEDSASPQEHIPSDPEAHVQDGASEQAVALVVENATGDQISGQLIERTTEDSSPRSKSHPSPVKLECDLDMLVKRKTEIGKAFCDIEKFVQLVESCKEFSAVEKTIIQDCCQNENEGSHVFSNLLHKVMEEKTIGVDILFVILNLIQKTCPQLSDILQGKVTQSKGFQPEVGDSEPEEKNLSDFLIKYLDQLIASLTDMSPVIECLNTSTEEFLSKDEKEVVLECCKDVSYEQAISSILNKVNVEDALDKKGLLKLLCMVTNECPGLQEQLKQLKEEWMQQRKAEENSLEALGSDLWWKFHENISEMLTDPHTFFECFQAAEDIPAKEKELMKKALEKDLDDFGKVIPVVVQESRIQTLSLWKILLRIRSQIPALDLLIEEMKKEPEAEKLISAVLCKENKALEVLLKYKELITETLNNLCTQLDSKGEGSESLSNEVIEAIKCLKKEDPKEFLKTLVCKILEERSMSALSFYRIACVLREFYPQLVPVIDELEQ
ncbi:DJC16 protein, partial [Polypterus senegalus]